MGLEFVDTNAIRRRVKTNQAWFPEGSQCRQEALPTTAAVSFPQTAPGKDDSRTIVCYLNPWAELSEIDVAEAFASSTLHFGSQYKIHPNVQTLFNLFSVLYAEESSPTVCIDQQEKKVLLERLWELAAAGIERLFQLANKAEIMTFLKQYSYYISVLDDVHHEISDIFGLHIVKLSLEYNRDIEEDYEGISVMIQTDLSVDESVSLLNHFDEVYWLKQEFKVRRLMTVMVIPQ